MDVLPTAIISCSSLVTMTSRRMSSCTRESFARLWTSRFRALSVIEWASVSPAPRLGHRTKWVLQGFVWVDASVKMPTEQRRHSLRVCFPDQAREASEGALPARHGG